MHQHLALKLHGILQPGAFYEYGSGPYIRPTVTPAIRSWSPCYGQCTSTDQHHQLWVFRSIATTHSNATQRETQQDGPGQGAARLALLGLGSKTKGHDTHNLTSCKGLLANSPLPLVLCLARGKLHCHLQQTLPTDALAPQLAPAIPVLHRTVAPGRTSSYSTVPPACSCRTHKPSASKPPGSAAPCQLLLSGAWSRASRGACRCAAGTT